MAADYDLEVVCAGELIGVKRRAGSAERHDAHEVCAFVVILQFFADVLRGRGAGQQAVVQHDRGRHSFVVVVDYGKEDGRRLQAADF